MTRRAGPPTARVFDVQRMSLHDGPGLRTTVFFQGCPLRCAWCHNPEGLLPQDRLIVEPTLCIACSECVDACPAGVAHGPRQDGPERCTVCGRCVEACPTGARAVAGREVGLDELVDLALRDRTYWGSAGGVTLGGGEPLAQWAFAAEFAQRLRGEGVHVALDTSACGTAEALAAVPEAVDLAIVDLKLADPTAHRRWTGADSAGILAAVADWAARMPGRLWISVPVVPDVHDAAELSRIADVLADLPNRPPVRVLPFERFGESKYRGLGLPTPGFAEDPALADRARAILEAAGLNVMPA